MSLVGVYVDTFAEATHALPQGMHMNADYPFKLPAITGRAFDSKSASIIIRGARGETATCVIKHDKAGREFCTIEQSSTFERLYGRKPHKFKLLPFKETR